MISPTVEEFTRLAQRGNLIPVFREIFADMETPVSAFYKINRRCSNAFLFESVEGGEKWGRYSFLAAGEGRLYRSKDTFYEILSGDQVLEKGHCDDPLQRLKEWMSIYQPVEVDGLPRFSGGAVGYLGYDMVRFIESLPSSKPREIDTYDSCFLLADDLYIFDNKRQKILVVANVHLDSGSDLKKLYQEGLDRVDAMVARLRDASSVYSPHSAGDSSPSPLQLESNFSKVQFIDAVERCKEYVRAGDIIQVVLSQRFTASLDVNPFDIYRALRTVNPSPYMFYLRFNDTLVIGASPEVLVRKEGDLAEVRPIAGTRPRGRNAEDDERLADELLADPKECAEHVMLVDLARNDLGRVCATGSVEVSEFKTVERYSHVMHIVSNVRGRLQDKLDSFDVFRAAFPAGTLSGAPKVRAMQIIDELEPCRREIYGGAVGYFSFSGNMDMAIAIRTLVVQDGRIHLQAGAGIVADSDPESEFQETVNKARAVVQSIEISRQGLD